MRCAAQHYEYVPDDMIVRYLAHEIEHRANTVEHTARHEPPDCFHRKRIKQRVPGQAERPQPTEFGPEPEHHLVRLPQVGRIQHL